MRDKVSRLRSGSPSNPALDGHDSTRLAPLAYTSLRLPYASRDVLHFGSLLKE